MIYYRGWSHVKHLDVADAGFDSEHSEQVHSPVATGALIPAAPQSKPLTVGFSGAAPFRGVSQTVHLAVASAGLSHMQVSHFQPPPDGALGALMPAAAQLNPPLVEVGALIGVEKSKGGREVTGLALAAICAGPKMPDDVEGKL